MKPSTTTKRPEIPSKSAFQSKTRDIVNQQIAISIYSNMLAFDVVSSSYWQKLVRQINVVIIGCTNKIFNEALRVCKGLRYKKLWGTLLKTKVKLVEDSQDI